MIFNNAVLENTNLKVTAMEMQEMQQADRCRFIDVKKNLFCPDCKKAKLKWVPRNQSSYFASINKQEHGKDCDYHSKKVTYKTLLKFNTQRFNNINVENVLENLLNELIEDEFIKTASIVNDIGKRQRNKCNHDAIIFKVNDRKYRIDKMNLSQGCFTDIKQDEIYYCYGKVLMSFEYKRIVKSEKGSEYSFIGCSIYDSNNYLLSDINIYKTKLQSDIQFEDSLIKDGHKYRVGVACLCSIKLGSYYNPQHYHMKVFKNKIKLIKGVEE